MDEKTMNKNTMNSKKYIVALDQGTTSCRCIVFDEKGSVCEMVQKEITQIYPSPGWVEHDPEEIFRTQLSVAESAVMSMVASGASEDEFKCISITNQRETTVVWDKETGKPVYNAIVWQCRRTSREVDDIKAKGHEDIIRKKTGLPLDAYFSGTKIGWILDNVEGAREKAENGSLLFGNIDAWLIWNLTGGKVHATDPSNASRTMLFDINKMEWGDELGEILSVPMSMLPQVRDSSGYFGEASIAGVTLPITGVCGDQQSALFGQTCFDKGNVKNTYGTGGFLIMNTGDTPAASENGLVTTVAWRIDGKTTYALEGSVFISGAVIQWLRDELGILVKASDSEEMAVKAGGNGGVYIVPAFTGMGAPYWNQEARGAIYGLTRGAGKNHIVRAALESIAFQTYDLVKAMENDIGSGIPVLNADGGAAANDFLMQFQSDILDADVIRPSSVETTALGSAYLAGLAAGIWQSMDEIRKSHSIDRVFKPTMESSERDGLISGWKKAVDSTLHWTE